MAVKTLRIALLAISLFLPVAASQAAVMNFDEDVPGFLTTYTEDGITMTAVDYDYGGYFYISSYSNPPGAVEFETVAHCDQGGAEDSRGSILFDMGGIPFDLESIAFGNIGANAASLLIVSSSGGTITLGPVDSWTKPPTLLGEVVLSSVAGFSAIGWFRVTPDGSCCFEFDEIVATPSAPVPEPGTLILLGSGLAGIFGGRKRIFGR